MLWGYFKKIVIADRAAVVVSEVFGNYQSYHGILVIAAYCAIPFSSTAISLAAWM